jgi:hypothetical protein
LRKEIKKKQLTMGVKPDCEQRGGFLKAVLRIKFGDFSTLVAPHCWRQLTPDVESVE